MRPSLRLLAVFLFLGGLLAAFHFSGLREHFSIAFLQQRLNENLFSGIALFVLLFVLGNLIQIPGWIFLAAAVLTLGKGWGGLATYLAATISCLVTFFAIRYLGGDALRQMKSRYAIALLARLDAHPLRNIVLLRMLFQTVPALNYALALSGVRLRHYLLGTLLGLPLPIALYCLFFEQLARHLHLT
jgi:uncharacterized membrane protein YdjX (TVP38/TMEM64 family)